ncbi:hypothetical protein CRG98_035168, partial [Punica granatum]
MEVSRQGIVSVMAVALWIQIMSACSAVEATISRGSFPKGFVFGTASSAFQYEGAVNEDGRGLTVWDTFAHKSGIEPYVTLYHWDLPQTLEDKYLGWLSPEIMLLDPLMFGDYPSSMKTRVGSRLPKFSQSESALVKGSLDFVGINHYTTYYAKASISNAFNDSLEDSGAITQPFKADFKPIGDSANSIWLYIVPRCIRSLMNYIKTKYENPSVIITEN